jgi:serine/threonine-protein kinase
MSNSPYSPGDVFIDKYRIERVLGAGNMGLVLSALHIGLEQRVAIKLMLPGKAAEEQHQRFLREARACARLKTQHAVKVLDVGKNETGAPYMVMEYLDGRDLAAELAARGPLPIAEAVEYVLQACEGLAEAHAAGIVHRDVKPANMYLIRGSGAPCVKVLDFGISKVQGDGSLALTSDVQSLGSPLYMSPEQLNCSRDVDGRTDLWALGVTLYELVAGSGNMPFNGERIEQLCTRIFTKPPTPLSTFRSDAPAGFWSVLAQCFEKEPDRRWPNVATLAAALVPYAPPRAAVYAERVAAVLGEHVEPARPTHVVRPEPEPEPAPPAAAAAGTGSALVRPAVVTTPRGPRARVVAVVGITLAVLVLGAVGLFRWRAGAAVPAAGPAASAIPVLATSSAAPPATAPVPPDRDRPPPLSQPTQEPTATPAPLPVKPTGSAIPRAPAVKPAATAVPKPAAPPSRPDPYAQ